MLPITCFCYYRNHSNPYLATGLYECLKPAGTTDLLSSLSSKYHLENLPRFIDMRTKIVDCQLGLNKLSYISSTFSYLSVIFTVNRNFPVIFPCPLPGTILFQSHINWWSPHRNCQYLHRTEGRQNGLPDWGLNKARRCRAGLGFVALFQHISAFSHALALAPSF